MVAPWRRLPFAWMAWLLAVARLVGAEATAQFDRDVVEVGGTAVLRVIITDAGNVPAPEIPPLAGVKTAFAGTGQQFAFANGRQSSSVIHSFAVTPMATGTVTIPPLVIPVNGGRLQTQPVSLQVTQGLDLSRFGFVELLTPTNEVYVGQAFPVRLRFLFRVSPRDVDMPTLSTDGFVVGRRPRPTSGQERIDGQVWGVVTSELALTAARTGELPIGPMEWSAAFPLPRRGRGPFEDPFFQGIFGGAEMRRFAFRSGTNLIRVIEPPEAGRPENYAGAVGRFSLNGTASPTEVTVGDPITVRVRVAGEGAIESLTLPELPSSENFRVYAGTNWFEPGDALGLTGARNFELVYVPQNPDVRLLPLPELPYFDPVKKTYGKAAARPLGIRVKPSATAQAVPTAQPTLPVVAAATTAPTPARTLRPLKTTAGSRGWHVPRPMLAGAVVLPAILVAGISLATRVRWRRVPDEARLRRQQLRARVDADRQRLAGLAAAGDAAGFLGTLGEALAGEIALRTGVPAVSVTAGIVDSHPMLRDLDDAVRRDLRDVFAVLDAARYAPSGAVTELERLRSQADRLLGALRSQEGRA